MKKSVALLVSSLSVFALCSVAEGMEKLAAAKARLHAERQAVRPGAAPARSAKGAPVDMAAPMADMADEAETMRRGPAPVPAFALDGRTSYDVDMLSADGGLAAVGGCRVEEVYATVKECCDEINTDKEKMEGRQKSEGKLTAEERVAAVERQREIARRCFDDSVKYLSEEDKDIYRGVIAGILAKKQFVLSERDSRQTQKELRTLVAQLGQHLHIKEGFWRRLRFWE